MIMMTGWWMDPRLSLDFVPLVKLSAMDKKEESTKHIRAVILQIFLKVNFALFAVWYRKIVPFRKLGELSQDSLKKRKRCLFALFWPTQKNWKKKKEGQLFFFLTKIFKENVGIFL